MALFTVSWRRGDKEEALEWYTRALDRLSRSPESDAYLLALRAEVEPLLGRSADAETRPKR